jgi:hypothetical protein
MSKFVKLALLSSIVVLTIPGAMAQSLFDRDRNIAVTERHEPNIVDEARVGAFYFLPQATTSLVQTDNVFATATNAESDLFFSFQPEARLVSNWSNHALSFFANLKHDDYQDFGTENTTDYGFGTNGRLDITRSTSISGGGGYDLLHEPRQSAAAAFASAAPIEFETTNYYVQAQHATGRMKFQGGVAFDMQDYEDGVTLAGAPFDQDFRDRDRIVFNVRADYAVSPDTALFVRYTGNERTYDVTPLILADRRDSNGYRVDAGVDLDIAGVARGLFGIGYMEQSYDGASFADINGFSLDARLQWFPSELTTVSFAASRDILDSATLGSAGMTTTAYSVTIDHELQRNVVLTANLGAGSDDYEGIDRTDDRLNAGAGINYYMNRHIELRANYAWRQQESSGVDARADFDESRLVFSAVFRP